MLSTYTRTLVRKKLSALQHNLQEVDGDIGFCSAEIAAKQKQKLDLIDRKRRILADITKLKNDLKL